MMSTPSDTLITTSPPAIPVAADAVDARDEAAGAQQPSLTVIDAAIMQAVAAGDIARRDALMAMRANSALAEILAACPGTMPHGPVACDDDSTDATDAADA